MSKTDIECSTQSEAARQFEPKPDQALDELRMADSGRRRGDTAVAPRLAACQSLILQHAIPCLNSRQRIGLRGFDRQFKALSRNCHLRT